MLVTNNNTIRNGTFTNTVANNDVINNGTFGFAVHNNAIIFNGKFSMAVMGNAPKSVKEAADYVTASNDQEGVYIALNSLRLKAPGGNRNPKKVR